MTRSRYQRRMDDRSRIQAMTVKLTRVSGKTLVMGTGEATFDVSFPVLFSERPYFQFGGELDDNYRVESGSFPTVSAVIVGWKKEGEIERAFDGRYSGATLAVRTTGTEGQQMWVHWTFESRALRNPRGADATLEDPI